MTARHTRMFGGSPHVPNPISRRGPQYSIPELSRLLQVSEAEIKSALKAASPDDQPPQSAIAATISTRKDRLGRPAKGLVTLYDRDAFVAWWRARS